MRTEPTSTEVTNVSIRELPGQDYLGLTMRSAVGSVGQDVQNAFQQLYTRIAEAHSRPDGPPFLIASPPKDGMMEIEVGAPCTPVPEPTAGLHAGRLEAGRAAVVLHRGPYDGIGPMYAKLFAWIGQHGYRQTCPPREIYLNGPDDVKSPADYLTELVVPVA